MSAHKTSHDQNEPLKYIKYNLCAHDLNVYLLSTVESQAPRLCVLLEDLLLTLLPNQGHTPHPTKTSHYYCVRSKALRHENQDTHFTRIKNKHVPDIILWVIYQTALSATLFQLTAVFLWTLKLLVKLKGDKCVSLLCKRTVTWSPTLKFNLTETLCFCFLSFYYDHKSGVPGTQTCALPDGLCACIVSVHYLWRCWYETTVMWI